MHRLTMLLLLHMLVFIFLCRILIIPGTPGLNPDSFGKWKLAMESHVRSASTQLWWIILRGHHPEDPSSLSPREEVDEPLNDIACHMLLRAVPDDYQDSIALLKTAKEIWGTLREIFEGDVSVQRSRLALLKTEVNMFVRKDGETADQVFRRLKSIVLDLRNYGCTWADDNFIKDRFLCAMILTDETMVTMIYQRMDFDQLTPNQIVSSFTTNSLLKTKSKQTHDLVHGINSSNNLALKAKKVASPSKMVEVEDVEEYCEEEDVPSCPANDFEEDVALLVRKYVGTMGTLGNKGSNNFKGKTFGRRKCYNCDSPKHFVADCPYERREEKSEKLTLKKKGFNKFAKRHGDKALVHEEYLSEDEEDGDDEHKGMDAIAMHTKSSSTSSSLFDSPNENKTIFHRCLMAREVISKSINSKTSSNTTNPLQE